MNATLPAAASSQPHTEVQALVLFKCGKCVKRFPGIGCVLFLFEGVELSQACRKCFLGMQKVTKWA